MDTAKAGPLQTLVEFQQTHELLLDQHDDGLAEIDSAAPDSADARGERAVLIGMLEPLKAFLRRGAEGGAYLFEAKERRAAQGLLDYWASLCYSANLDIPRPLLLPHDAGLRPSLDGVACPYVGLEAFGERDARHFFGREERVQALIQRLRTERLVVVTGASGSGKSSLVLAGLLPALRAGALPGSADWCYLPPLVPGDMPLVHLLNAVAAALRPDAPCDADWLAEQVQRLRARPSDLVELLAAEGRPAVIVVDQFEEAMTLRAEANAADFAAFVAALESLLSTETLPHRLLLTMRSDVDTQLAREYPELNRRYGGAAFPLVSMDSKQLREAIEAPALQAGLKFQDGVVDDLIRSVVGEDAGLPLLQFSLMALWERRHGNLVTLEALREVGSPRQAMTVAAARLYDNLSRDQQLATERIFLALSRQGDGATVFRNRATRRQLHEVSEPSLAERVIDKFERARLLRVTRRDPAEPLDDVVEVAHEALLRGWDLLQRLFAERRYELERRAFLRKQALKWREAGFDAAFLLSGLALRQAVEEIERASMNALELDFVDKSLAAEQMAEKQRAEETERRLQLVRDEARISRRLLWTSLAVVGVLLLTTTMAWRAYQRAEQVLSQAERDSAEVLRKSVADRLAVEASTSVDTDADLSLFYASEAVRRDPSLLPRVMPSVLESLRYRRADLRLLPERIGPVDVLALNPRGDRLLLVNGANASEWSVAGGAASPASAALRQIAWPEGAGTVRQAVYALDGQLIVLASSKGVWLWSEQEGEDALQPLAKEPVTQRLSVSEDGKLIAALSEDRRQVWVWRLPERKLLLSYRAANAARNLYGAGFPAGSGQLVVAVEPDPSELWPGALVFEQRGEVFDDKPQQLVGTLCSPPGVAFAVAGFRVGLLQWPHLCVQDLNRLAAPDAQFSSQKQDEVVDDIVFSGDGRQVVKLMRHSNEALVESLDGGSVTRLQGAFDLPERDSYEPLLSISANGERLAIKGNDGAVRLFDLGASNRPLLLRGGVVWTSPEDKLVVTRISSPAGAVFEARDAATGAVLRRLGGGEGRLAELEHFVLDADRRHLHAQARCGPAAKPGANAPRCIVSQDLLTPDGAPHEQPYTQVLSRVDGLYLLDGNEGLQVYSASARRLVWTQPAAARQTTPQTREARMADVALGSGGRFAVKEQAAGRAVVKVYMVEAGEAKLLRQIERPALPAYTISFKGQGRCLLLASAGGSELWDLQSAADTPALVVQDRSANEMRVDANTGIIALRRSSFVPWALRELGSGRSLGELPAGFRIEPSGANAWARVEGGWEIRALSHPQAVLLAGSGMAESLQFDRSGTVVAVRLPREDRLRVYRLPGRQPTLEGRLGSLRNARLTEGGRYLESDGLLVPVDGAELLKLAAQPVQSRITDAERCRLVRDKLACQNDTVAPKP